MNKMAEFAKLLGKELDEEFIVKAAEDYKCKMTNEGLLVYVPVSPWWVERNNYLYDLISGKFEIKNSPWEAGETEQYYVPNIRGDARCYTFPGAVLDITTKPESYYVRGLMCKTQEQAEELAHLLIRTARKFQGFDDMEEAQKK